MSLTLLYGRTGLELTLPESANPHVIEKPPFPATKSQQDQVLDCLSQPVASLPLAELCQGRTSACILICDITRPVPNHLFLQPMIREMLAAGIPQDKITVLIATGLHRPNEGEELAELIGDPWVLETVAV